MNKNSKGFPAAVVIAAAAIVAFLVLRKNSVSAAARTVFGLLAVVILIVVLGSILILVLALKSSNREAKFKASTTNTISDENAAMLKSGRESLMVLRKKILRIHNSAIHEKATQICNVMDKILQTLREKQDKISDVRQFFNYYMPTLDSILTKYQRIEESGTLTDDMTEKVVAYLVTIKGAMDKQYENLFKEDRLDMSVDMEAMTMACKRDGLIEDAPPASQTSDVHLTL